MLPKNSRIERKGFTSLLQSRSFFNSAHFTIRVAESVDKYSHIGVSVSKKISKKAVIRNRTRRRVYSIMREILPLKKPAMILFVAKSGAEKLKGEALKKEIMEVLSKVDLVV